MTDAMQAADASTTMTADLPPGLGSASWSRPEAAPPVGEGNDGKPPAADDGKQNQVADEISGHLQKLKQQVVFLRQRFMDNRLQDCADRRNGVYDATFLQAVTDIGGNATYWGYTGLKCRQALAQISKLIRPPGEKRPWGLGPGAVPELPPEEVQRVAGELAQRVAELGLPPEAAYSIAKQFRDERDTMLMQEANRRALRAEKRVAAQFEQGGMDTALAEFLDDLVTFPTAILAMEVRMRPVMEFGADGMPTEARKPVVTYRRVDPHMAYPSAMSGGVDDGFFMERQWFTRQDLYGLVGLDADGYSTAAVNAVLTEYENKGRTEINPGDTERLLAENKDMMPIVGSADDRIEGWHYWGNMSGAWLQDWGMDKAEVPDRNVMYNVCCVVVGNRTIKCMLNPTPLGKRPYFITSYEKVPRSFWGKALPEIVAPAQDAINATLRAAIDNLAFASGPMVILELDRILPEAVKTALKLEPRKVYVVKPSPYGSNASPVQFQDVPMNIDPLTRFLDKMVEMGDILSGIPAYAFGAKKQSLPTVGGFELQLENSAQAVLLIANQVNDDVLAPVIQTTCLWDMLHFNDPDIIGDLHVVARGTLQTVFRERLQQKRIAFIQTVQQVPEMKQWVTPDGWRELTDTFAADLELPGIIAPAGRPVPSAAPQPQPQPEPAGAAPTPSPAQAQAA